MKKSAIHLLLILSGIVFLYPFLWMLAASFRPEYEIARAGLLAPHFTLRSYRVVFESIPIVRAFFNSLLVSSCVTVSVVLCGSIVGYAQARLDFRGRGLILNIMLLAMIVPFQITMIPLFMMVVKMGLTDSYLGLIVPAMVNAFAILLFRQFFLDLPQDLVDAARIDGCHELGILFRIFYPLSKPAIITVGLLTFMGAWNDVLWPILVIRSRSLMTMPQMVTLFAIGGQAERLGPQLAAAVLLALPVIAAYAFFQRFFIESTAFSGLKN